MADTDPIQRLNAALEGRYRIERELGAGGMAVVYLAEDLRHHRQVALKVLRPELAAVVGSERFLAEIETTANLQHPHILPLFDSGETDGFVFYVMPYVEGETLRARLDREHQLPVAEATEITSKVTSALDYAHARGVIHRDIKPANILLNETGEPLVADFGIALAVSVGGGDRLTETGLSLGTPHYMSPEQATGDLNVGPRADIYALGCVLYEMLIGEPPFTGSTPQAVLGKIITGETRSASAQRPSVPTHVDAAILRALEKIPADRFRSAGEMSQALRGAAPLPLARGAVGPAAFRRAWVAWGFAAVATLLLAWEVMRPDSIVPVTRLGFPVPGGYEITATVPSLAISPDGRTVVYRSEGRLFRRFLDRGSSEAIPETEGAELPTFSADGSAIAFVRDGRLYQVAANGAQVTRLSDVSVQVPRGMWWSADGSIVYSPPPGSLGIWRLDPGSDPRQITELDPYLGEVGHLWPQLIDDGTKVLFTVIGPNGGWADARLAVWDLEKAERWTVVEKGTHGRYVEPGQLFYATAEGNVAVVNLDLTSMRTQGDPVIVETGVRVAQWGGGASYAVSDEGTLAFAPGSTFSRRLMTWFDRAGRPVRQLGPAFAGEGAGIAPGGDLVTMVMRTPENTDIWVWTDSSGERSRQTFDLGEDESPVWGPDGRRIAYRTATARGSAIRIKSLGGDPETVLETSLHVHVESWSPDGRWIAVSGQRAGAGRDVFLLDLERPDSLVELLSTPANEDRPRFSPDGRYLAYESDVDGRTEIYLRRVPDFGGLRQVTFGGGESPRWSEDGRELYFFRSDTLFTSAISSTGEASNPSPLFRVEGIGDPFYDVAPDAGEFLMIIRNPDGPAPIINVTLNVLSGLNAP